MSRWILYGADNSFGRRLLEALIDKQMQPTIAGKNSEFLLELSKKWGLDVVVLQPSLFSCDLSFLLGFEFFVNCYEAIEEDRIKLMKTCGRLGISYIDFFYHWEDKTLDQIYRAPIKNNSSTILGCNPQTLLIETVAAKLKRKCPGANFLQIFLSSGITDYFPLFIKRIIIQSFLRNYRNDRFKGFSSTIPSSFVKSFEFYEQSVFGFSFYHPSLFHLWHITKIPNMQFYKESCSSESRLVRSSLLLNRLPNCIASRWFEDWFVTPLVGISEERKKETPQNSFLWGQVSNQKEEHYDLKIHFPVSLMSEVGFYVDSLVYLFQKNYQPGFYTPSKIFPLDYMNSLNIFNMEFITNKEPFDP